MSRTLKQHYIHPLHAALFALVAALLLIPPAHAQSPDPTLATLSIDEGTLSPAFASGTTAYTVEVAHDVTSVTVRATANDPDYYIGSWYPTVGDGDRFLNNGERQVRLHDDATLSLLMASAHEIIVYVDMDESPYSRSAFYTITVTRRAPPRTCR